MIRLPEPGERVIYKNQTWEVRSHDGDTWVLNLETDNTCTSTRVSRETMQTLMDATSDNSHRYLNSVKNPKG